METSLIGVVLNGLSHLSHVRNKSHFAMCLIRGLGGNLNEGARENFAKEVGDNGMCIHHVIFTFFNSCVLSFLLNVSILFTAA